MVNSAIKIPIEKYENDCSLINSKYQLESGDNHSFQYIKDNAITTLIRHCLLSFIKGTVVAGFT